VRTALYYYADCFENEIPAVKFKKGHHRRSECIFCLCTASWRTM